MAKLDHVILKVNDLAASVAFYTEILGFKNEGRDGPFTVIRAGPDCQLQLAPWGTPGMEHYAFAVSRDELGSNSGPGEETGARGLAPTLYFNDPNRHLLEIRSYDQNS